MTARRVGCTPILLPKVHTATKLTMQVRIQPPAPQASHFTGRGVRNGASARRDPLPRRRTRPQRPLLLYGTFSMEDRALAVAKEAERHAAKVGRRCGSRAGSVRLRGASRSKDRGQVPAEPGGQVRAAAGKTLCGRLPGFRPSVRPHACRCADVRSWLLGRSGITRSRAAMTQIAPACLAATFLRPSSPLAPTASPPSPPAATSPRTGHSARPAEQVGSSATTSAPDSGPAYPNVRLTRICATCAGDTRRLGARPRHRTTYRRPRHLPATGPDRATVPGLTHRSGAPEPTARRRSRSPDHRYLAGLSPGPAASRCTG